MEFFSKLPYTPKDRIRGTVVFGTGDRDTIKSFAEMCLKKLKFLNPDMNVETAIIKPVPILDQKKVGDGYFDVKIYVTIRYNTPTAMAFWKKRELNYDVDKLRSVGRGGVSLETRGYTYLLSEAEYTSSFQMKKELSEKDYTLKREQYEIIINGYGDFLAKSGLKKFKELHVSSQIVQL